MKDKKIILHLCADTGSDTKPYKDNGYKVILVGSDIGVENFIPPKKVHGIIANPVCAEFSFAREGYLFGGKKKQKTNPKQGMSMVDECRRIIEQTDPVWWVIENPAKGKLKNYIGPPRYMYEPWWYGSPWTKKTALWGKFNIPERKYFKWEDVPKIEGLYQRPTRGKPSLAFLHKSAYNLIEEFWTLPRPKTDAEFRSICSQKFAQAFYEANK